MFKYQKFIKDCIGKKRNNFTFIALHPSPSHKKSDTIVDCQCNCGRIVQYPAGQCIGTQFPFQCRICHKRKKIVRGPQEQQAEQEFMESLIACDPIEDGAVLALYDDKYKKYYRD